jgi:hypothetical protein
MAPTASTEARRSRAWAKVALAGVAGVAGGLALGRLPGVSRAGAQPCPVPTFLAQDAPPPVQALSEPVAARLSEEDKLALRAMVRQEVAAMRPPSTASETESSASVPPPPVEVIAALASARDSVDDAIVRGGWTPADRRQLRARLAGVSAEKREEVMLPLIVAVNEGRVRFDGHGPLY